MPDCFKSRFFARWNDADKGLHRLLGHPGFRLPEIAGFDWRRLGDADDERNNFLLTDADITHYSFDIAADVRDNIIILPRSSTCSGRIILRGSRNLGIIIGGTAGHHPVNVHFHNSDHVFFFGAGATSNTATFEMGCDGTAILVGEDCMFSAFIDVTSDDHHAIIDLETGAHLNPGADVIIHPHVWIGMHCMILKGVEIGFGSIVGARSTVTQSLPAKVLAAGSPAKIVRTGVGWVRDRSPNAASRAQIEAIETGRTIGSEIAS